MKKTLAVLLALAMVLCFVSCGEKKETSPDGSDAAETVQQEQQSPVEEITTEDEVPDPYLGVFSDENGSTLEIGLTENTTHSVKMNITRLANFDDGEGNMSDGGLSFMVTDPNGGPLYGMINIDPEDAGQNTMVVVITDSTWSLLPNDTEFTFTRVIPKSEQAGTAGSRIPLKDNLPEAETQILATVENYLREAWGDKIDDLEVTISKIYSAEDEAEIDALKEMELGPNEIAFSVNYKLHPAKGVEDLMQFTAGTGEIDEESGWIVEKSNIGILRPNPDDEGYIITNFGTGW